MAEADDAKKALKETSNSALGLAKSLALTKPGLTDFASKIPFLLKYNLRSFIKFSFLAAMYKKTSVTESVGLGLNNILHHCCEDILIENAFYKAIGSYVCTHKSLPLNQYLLVSSKLDLPIPACTIPDFSTRN